MKNRTRKYYVPGIITLILLPIFCCMYLSKYNKDERVIEVTFCEKYNPNKICDSLFRFDTTILSLPKYKRIYTDIELNADTKINNQNIKLFKKRLIELKKNNDTIHGIHIVFGDAMKYEYFIEAIDVCYKCDSFPSYAVYENNLWTAYWKMTKENIDRSRARLKAKLSADNLMREEKAYASINIPYDLTLIIKLSILTLVFSYLIFISIRKMIK